MKPPAEDDFRRNILQNLKFLENGLVQSINTENTRESVAAALETVIEFITAIDDFKGLHAPLWALRLALSDLEMGIVASFLQPKSFANGHPQSTIKKTMQAWIAYSVDTLMSGPERMSCDKACKFVANELAKLGYPIEGKRESPPWRTVKNWRDGFSKLGSADPGRGFLTAMRVLVPAAPELSATDRKRHVADSLKAAVYSMGRFSLESLPSHSND